MRSAALWALCVPLLLSGYRLHTDAALSPISSPAAFQIATYSDRSLQIMRYDSETNTLVFDKPSSSNCYFLKQIYYDKTIGAVFVSLKVAARENSSLLADGDYYLTRDSTQQPRRYPYNTAFTSSALDVRIFNSKCCCCGDYIAISTFYWGVQNSYAIVAVNTNGILTTLPNITSPSCETSGFLLYTFPSSAAITGSRGSTGPTEPTGLTGPTGLSLLAYTGLSGESGLPGGETTRPAGSTILIRGQNRSPSVAEPGGPSSGPTGIAGVNGAVGPQGAGISGPTGASGPAGPPGESGPAGPSGTGATGLTGESGPGGSVCFKVVPGLKGPTGTPGSSGAAGPAGAPGPTGTPGSSGAAGQAGAPGPTGTPGSSGAAGQAGASGFVPGFYGAVGIVPTNLDNSGLASSEPSEGTFQLVITYGSTTKYIISVKNFKSYVWKYQSFSSTSSTAFKYKRYSTFSINSEGQVVKVTAFTLLHLQTNRYLVADMLKSGGLRINSGASGLTFMDSSAFSEVPDGQTDNRYFVRYVRTTPDGQTISTFCSLTYRNYCLWPAATCRLSLQPVTPGYSSPFPTFDDPDTASLLDFHERARQAVHSSKLPSFSFASVNVVYL